MTLIFLLFSSSLFVLMSSEVHGKALSVNNNSCSGKHGIKDHEIKSMTEVIVTRSMKQMTKNVKLAREISSDTIIFPSDDSRDNDENQVSDVETTTITIPNRVIFDTPVVCNPGEKKDSKGRCRKNIS